MVIVYHSAFCRSDMEVVVFPGNTSPVVNVYSEQSLAGSGCNAFCKDCKKATGRGHAKITVSLYKDFDKAT